MPEFYADWERMIVLSEDMGELVREMDEALREANSVSNRLYCIGSEEISVGHALNKCGGKLERVINGTRKCQDVMRSAAEHYRLTENSMYMESVMYPASRVVIRDILKRLTKVYGEMAEEEKNNERWNLGRGEWLGNTSLLGLISLSGSAAWEFLGGSLKGSGQGISFDIKNGNVGIDYGYEGDFDVFSVSGRLDRQIEGTDIGISDEGRIGVGNVSSSGKIGATLFKDGKFSPSIEAALEGKVSVLNGEVSHTGRWGDNEIRTSVDGDVLGAEAVGDVRFGSISYEDRNGNIRYADGKKIKIGAEAYIAKGRVAKGITIFGVDVDFGLSAAYGGVGATGEVMQTDKCVKAQLGADLGLGADIDFMIDWSNFSWDKLDIFHLF